MKKKRHSYNVLIAAGPTREFIDPVRFITNPSTGTIGYLIAERAKADGHNVILLSGPTHLLPLKKIKTMHFNSALELKKLSDRYFPWADCFICSAAIGDFRPFRRSFHKIKKNKGMQTVKLIKNPDILKGLGKKKKNKILIGFALETDNIIKNSKKKLIDKNLDFIIANKLSKSSFPFGNKQVRTFFIDKNGVKQYAKISKSRLSRIILDRVENLCYSQRRLKKRR